MSKQSYYFIQQCQSFFSFKNLNSGDEARKKSFLDGAGRGHDEALRGLRRPEDDDGVEAAPDDARGRLEDVRVQFDVAELMKKNSVVQRHFVNKDLDRPFEN